MLYDIPTNARTAKPILQRFITENASVAAQNFSGWQRPQPPRSAMAQSGSLEVLITWNAPQNQRSILGYRVYKDNEGNLVSDTADPSVRQIKIKLPSSTKNSFYVSSYNAQKESIKVLAIGTSNTDQIVVAGTSGGTGGTSPSPPPGYPHEPTGGSGKRQEL